MTIIGPSSAQPSPQPQGPSASGSLGQYTFTRAEVKGLSQVGVFLRKAADYLKHVFTQFSFVKPAISLQAAYSKTGLVEATNQDGDETLKSSNNVKMFIDKQTNAVDLNVNNFSDSSELMTDLKTWFTGENNEPFFSLPIGTFIGKEAHAVTVLICKATQQILVLDGKGADPKDLKIANAGIKQTPSETTLDDVLKKVVIAAGDQYTVTGCPNFQKSMDCALVAAAMQEAVVNHRNSHPKEEKIDLGNVIAPITKNYQRVNQIGITALRLEIQKEKASEESKQAQIPKTIVEKIEDWADIE